MTMDRYEAETQLKERAFDEEREKLERVVEAIRQGAIRLESQKPATADHQQTANEIQRVLDSQSENFWRAIEQPYFGRLDYVKVEERSPDSRARRLRRQSGETADYLLGRRLHQ